MSPAHSGPPAPRPDGASWRWLTHGRALALLAATWVVFFGPFLVRGHVVFAHDNALELGLTPQDPPGLLSNRRRFRDLDAGYLAEIHKHLAGRRAGWIASWVPEAEMGRPAGQWMGVGKGFLPLALLSLVSNDVLRVYTWLVVGALVLSGLFAFLFLRARGLLPAACLCGGVGMSLGVDVVSWMAAAPFLWAFTGALALLWLVERCAQELTPARLLGLALCVNLQLCGGYPQSVVWSVYVVGAFALARFAGLGAARWRFAIAVGGAAAVGLLASLPGLLDLLDMARRSVRVAEVGDAFFLKALPPLASLRDGLLLGAQLVDSSIFGNPVSEDSRLGYATLSLTPLFAGLLLSTPALLRRASVAPWLAGAALGVLLTLWPGAYLFAVHHLGLSLSRLPPIFGLLPVFVLAGAFACDVWLREPGRMRLLRTALAASGSCLVLGGVWVAPEPLEPARLGVAIAAQAAVLGFLWRPSPRGLVGLLLLGAFVYALPVAMFRPTGSIRQGGPFLEAVARYTGEHGRFAFVRRSLMPANQQLLHGIRSPHSYNSLSSHAFRDFVLGISESPPTTHGRHFQWITSPAKLDEAPFSFTGIRLLVSRIPIPEAIAEPVGRIRRFGVYRVRAPQPTEAQVRVFEAGGDGGVRIAGRLEDAPGLPLRRLETLDDALHLAVTGSERESLLFLSQQHHPDWRAWDGAGRSLETPVVNGFYQGVRLPPGTREVRLRYFAASRFAWLSHAGFGMAALVLVALRVRRRLGS